MNTKSVTRPFKIKEIAESGVFEGYGSVFGTVDSYRDVILPGAFEQSLADHKERGSMPALLWQHQPDEPIGVYSEMREDDHGLFVKGQLLVNQSVPNADKAYSLLKAEAVTGLSIGFNVAKGGETFDEDANVWELSEIDLWETSIVTFPANRDAQITEVRASYFDGISAKEMESILRDVGLTRRQSRAFMADGFSGLSLRDVADEIDETTQSAKSIIETLRGT